MYTEIKYFGHIEQNTVDEKLDVNLKLQILKIWCCVKL
jgi:hypothetical protein